MRVYVATPKVYSVAARAIRMEAIGVEEWVCTEPFDYGRYFAATWDEGEPFVLVEHDTVPWPGAVKALHDCEQSWCIHRYPIGRGDLERSWTVALGIGKYRPSGSLPTKVTETPWQLLDGVVVPALRERFGEPHIHEPPVAHAKEGSR